MFKMSNTLLVYQIAKLNTGGDQDTQSQHQYDNFPHHTDSDIDHEQQMVPCEKLSAELWVRVFGNLERNDIDSCEHVCGYWQSIITHNKKLLPGREIDYVMISSKRIFSMVLSSGNLVKFYRFNKYFDQRSIHSSLNDKSNMVVETFRRPKGISNKNKSFQFYIDELRGMLEKRTKSNSANKNENRNDDHVVNDRNAIDLAFPPRNTKTIYKICTPPKIFFEKLDDLLRNHGSIKYFIFQTFTFTNSFATYFSHHVRPINEIGYIKLLRVKKANANSTRAFQFIFGILLNDGTISSRIVVGNDRYITAP